MITTITGWKIFENNISPNRFRFSDLDDIIDFVEELLYNPGKIDITEKIAGQHITININNNFVTVNNKDSLLNNTGSKNANRTKYGKEITKPLMIYLQNNKLPDQTWTFEIINPKYNHDFIKYKNNDIVFIEYTGNLSEDVANELRKLLYPNIRLLTKRDIKINIDKNKYYDNFKNKWETYLGRKIKSMNKHNRSRYYKQTINKLKYDIGELLGNILISVIDKVSPVEGIVADTNTPIKLQTNDFLKIQRIQMPLYSIFKINRHEINTVLDNPNKSFQYLKDNFKVELNSIYKGDLNKSLYDVIKNYLEENSKLDINVSHYRQWLSKSESKSLLNRLTHNTVKDVYMEIYGAVH